MDTGRAGPARQPNLGSRAGPPGRPAAQTGPARHFSGRARAGPGPARRAGGGDGGGGGGVVEIFKLGDWAEVARSNEKLVDE